MKKKLLYSIPIILGYCILMVFPWDWLWNISERIFQVPIDEGLREIGNSYFRLVTIATIALKMREQCGRGEFCKKEKPDLRLKILLCLALLLTEAVFTDMVWRSVSSAKDIIATFDNDFWFFRQYSVAAALVLAFYVASALTEEVYFRYITCNCLKKLHINSAGIILLQALFFTVLHKQEEVLWYVNIFICGIVYGLFLYITGTPIYGFFLHLSHNLAVLSEESMRHTLYGVLFFISIGCLLAGDYLSLKMNHRDDI